MVPVDSALGGGGSICNVQLNLSVSLPYCPLCSHCNPAANFSRVLYLCLEGQPPASSCWTLVEKVRATSVILFLGVGSFVCYKLFHRLRNKFLSKGEETHLTVWSTRKLSCTPPLNPNNFKEDDQNSHLSIVDDEEFDLESFANGIFDEREFESDFCPLAMGIGSSNSNIPVYFSKADGIHFNVDLIRSSSSISIPKSQVDPATYNSPPSKSCINNYYSNKTTFLHNNNNHPNHSNNCNNPTPFHLDLDDASPEELLSSDGITPVKDLDSLSICDSLSYDDNFWNQQDAISLLGNFSPSSLKEKYLKAGLNGISDPSYANKPDPSFLQEESIAGSLDSSLDLNKTATISRNASFDSEIAQIFTDIQKETAQEETEIKFDHLQTDLQDVKHLMEELDAELEELQLLQKNKPSFGFHLTDISDFESHAESENSVVNIVQQHKAKIKAKGLMDEESESSDSLKLISSFSLPWDPPSKVPDILPKQDPPPYNSKSADSSPLSHNEPPKFPLKSEFGEMANGEDSGSDFGNSLELDSDAKSSIGPNTKSLEWDPLCLPDTPAEDEVFISPSCTDGGSFPTEIKHAATSFPLLHQIKKAIHHSNSNENRSKLKSPHSSLSNESSSSSHAPTIESSLHNFEDTSSLLIGDPNGNLVKDRPKEKSLIGSMVNLSHLRTHYTTMKEDVFNELSRYGSIRLVHPDHASLIRGILFHLLAQGSSLLQRYGGAKTLYKRFEEVAQFHPWILSWGIGSGQMEVNEGKGDEQALLEKIKKCLAQVEQLDAKLYQASPEVRPKILRKSLNHRASAFGLDESLILCTRLQMILSALALHHKLQNNQPVPLFALVLFVDNSHPSQLLPSLWSSRPLEQIEIFLLAHTLGINLRIFRIHLHGTDDFVSHYSDLTEKTSAPEDMIAPLLEDVTMITENDAHYHLLYPL